MSECVHAHACKFINVTMRDNEALQNLLRNKYCSDTRNECARFRVLRELGGLDHVPADLWPDDSVTASRLIVAAAR